MIVFSLISWFRSASAKVHGSLNRILKHCTETVSFGIFSVVFACCPPGYRLLLILAVIDSRNAEKLANGFSSGFLMSSMCNFTWIDERNQQYHETHRCRLRKEFPHLVHECACGGTRME